MQIWLPVIIYGTTVALGLVLGWHFLSSKRPNQGWQVLHLVTGFGGLEVVMLVTRATRGDPVLAENAKIAIVILGFAVVSGLFVGIMGQSRKDNVGPAVLAHTLIGGTAFLLLANWTLNAA